MYTFIIVIIFIVSALLVLLVLVQNSKGGGLSSSFSSSNQVMGVRRTTDFLEKATWVLAMDSLFFQSARQLFFLVRVIRLNLRSKSRFSRFRIQVRFLISRRLFVILQNRLQ